MRQIAVAVIALLATLVTALLSLPDQVIAAGRLDLVRVMPVLPGVAAEPLLVQKAGRRLDETDRRLAISAVEASPVSPLALTRLADDARLSGNDERASRLLSLAGRLTWHQVIVQAAIVDFAIAHNDPARAVLHADALLREGDLVPEIFDVFDRNANVIGFRAALASRISLHPAWAEYYLAIRGANLPTAALQSYLAVFGRTLDRSLERPLLVGLLQRHRFEVIREILSAESIGGAKAGALPWPTGDALNDPTPFDWSLGSGINVSSDGSSIQPSKANQSDASVRLMALPAGAYRLSVSRNGGEWEWGIACVPMDAVPVQELSSSRSFSIDSNCPLQQLSVKPAPTNIDVPLPVLSVVSG